MPMSSPLTACERMSAKTLRYESLTIGGDCVATVIMFLLAKGGGASTLIAARGVTLREWLLAWASIERLSSRRNDVGDDHVSRVAVARSAYRDLGGLSRFETRVTSRVAGAAAFAGTACTMLRRAPQMSRVATDDDMAGMSAADMGAPRIVRRTDAQGVPGLPPIG